MAFLKEQRVVVTSEVLSRNLDGEAVLLDLASGTYFGLADAGATLWALFEKGTTVGEASARLVAEYDVDAATAERDLDALLADLARRGLVEIS